MELLQGRGIPWAASTAWLLWAVVFIADLSQFFFSLGQASTPEEKERIVSEEARVEASL